MRMSNIFIPEKQMAINEHTKTCGNKPMTQRSASKCGQRRINI